MSVGKIKALPIESLGGTSYLEKSTAFRYNIQSPLGAAYQTNQLYRTQLQCTQDTTLYGVLQGDLPKGDVHGSVSGPNLLLFHQLSAIAVDSVDNHSLSLSCSLLSTTHNFKNNIRTQYAAWLKKKQNKNTYSVA